MLDVKEAVTFKLVSRRPGRDGYRSVETRVRRSPMPRRHRNRLTIRRAMGLIAATGVVLGLLVAANRDDDQGIVAVLLIASLVVVVPVHFAIEANRRDALNAGQHRPGDPDQKVSPGPV
jgi:hypothetical protein